MIRAVIHSLLGAAAVVTTASIASWRGLPGFRPIPAAWILVAVILPSPLAVGAWSRAATGAVPGLNASKMTARSPARASCPVSGLPRTRG